MFGAVFVDFKELKLGECRPYRDRLDQVIKKCAVIVNRKEVILQHNKAGPHNVRLINNCNFRVISKFSHPAVLKNLTVLCTKYKTI